MAGQKQGLGELNIKRKVKKQKQGYTVNDFMLKVHILGTT